MSITALVPEPPEEPQDPLAGAEGHKLSMEQIAEIVKGQQRDQAMEGVRSFTEQLAAFYWGLRLQPLQPLPPSVARDALLEYIQAHTYGTMGQRPDDE